MNRNEIRLTFSNLTSITTFPTNSTSKFRVNLTTPLNFGNEKWEVALYEMSYPKSWFKIQEDSEISFWTHAYQLTKPEVNIFFIATTGVNIDELPRDRPITLNFNIVEPSTVSVNEKVSRQFRVVYNKRFYGSVDEVLSVLNLRMLKNKNFRNQWDKFQGFTYEEFDSNLWHAGWTSDARRIQIIDPRAPWYDYQTNMMTKFRVNKGLELWRKLGFTNLEIGKEYTLPIVGTAPPTLKVSVPAIFVYAPSLVEYQYVGDTSSPLLEYVAISSLEKGKLLQFRQSTPLFKRLAQGYINTIEIELRDILGNLVEFSSGQVLVTLLFRKCR